ncbi:hypothetical protein BBJ28_00013565 [Nothophytophthora sp. Chile5]|nr:hypothetical protein BBJ28_00013565 [Nothophytophthora sp. Chile5]
MVDNAGKSALASSIVDAEEGAVKASARDRASSGMLRKELDMRLTAYLPAVVRRHLERQDMLHALPVPATHRTTVVSMFADVSGFTAMTESLAARGPVGAEDLGKHLNSYFEQLLRLVSSAGGDVFKFAGDAMLIFWPESKEDTMDSLLRRALQCALRIQSHLHQAELAPGVVLSVKVGVGIGEATIAHLGGESDGATARIEYVAVGPALEQAFNAEHQAEAGDVICSHACWERVGSFFAGQPVRSHDDSGSSGFHKVTSVSTPVKICSRRPSFTRHDALLHARMKQYVSRAVWPYLDAHDEFWGSELRDVTVLFINLGFSSEQDLAKMRCAAELQKLQDAFANVQKCVYDYEGTINKFLVDDKGSTVIAAFGLPPVTHENDPIRGILASLAICAALGTIGLKASVGITTGTALCGVVGHQGNRREYTVLGDIVNLSARLMQRAKSERGGVITDASTKNFTHDVLHFEERPEIMVKGKNESIKIHRPYPRMSILLDYHLSSTIQNPPRKVKSNAVRPAEAFAGRTGGVSGASRAAPIQNLMDNMHRVQVRDAQRRSSLRAERHRLPTEALVESESFVKGRAALLDKCSQLNRFAPGGAFVLEGDIGVGKSVLLRSALASPEAGDYQVLVGTASPYATRKPYAIWSEIITKSAMNSSGRGVPGANASHLGCKRASTVSGTAATDMSVQSSLDGSREVETVRRECVAHFVRQKIREGAEPNTTLVHYAHLLNTILDTDFDAFPDTVNDGSDTPDRASCRGPSVKLLEGDIPGDGNNSDVTARSYATGDNASNQDEEHGDEKKQSQHDEDVRACGYACAESPGKKSLSVKEEEIASWFLGLLELDLAQKEESSALSGGSPSSSLPGCSPTANNEIETHDVANNVRDKGGDERESEWRPMGLDLSGILLLCAFHAMSRECATVFCLDSAMYMDEKSWILVTIIAKYFTNCLVVVVTRPPSLALGENTASSSFRKQLCLLKNMKPTVCESLEPFSSEDIEALSRQILKVSTIPSPLLTILVSRSQGNPLFLYEIIAEMQQQQVITVDSNKQACELHVQEPWGDKSSARFCFACHLKFPGSKAKHRCKCCGYVFCVACTPKACQTKLPGTSNEPVRHCRMCYNLSSARRPSGSFHGSGSVASAGNDKRARPKSRIRSIFHTGSSGDHSSAFSTTSSSAASSASPTQMLTNRIALRPPRTVKSVLTTMLDQLSVSQRMLMKTASVIGPVFEVEMLRGTCPIKAHLSRFAQDLEDLEQLAMIRRIDTFIGGVPANCKSPSPTASIATTKSQATPLSKHLKVKFEFSHGFMLGVLRDQMLRSQLDKLHARISEFREQQEKELRHRFFAKANESLSRPLQLAIPSAVEGSRGIMEGVRRALTPTQASLAAARHPGGYEDDGSQHRRRPLARRNSHLGLEVPSNGASLAVAPNSDHGTASSESSSESSTTQVLQDESEDDGAASSSPASSPVKIPISKLRAPNTIRTMPTFMRLKTGRVFVKKQSSVFSHLKFKGLTNARQWKTRYAVLQNVRLLLQYDEVEVDGSMRGGGTGSALPLQHGPRQGTSIFLNGAKVSACDPEVASKVNCFQVEVSEWTKGKYLMAQRRTFVIGVESEEEVSSWVYMIRYAIESLESQPAKQQQRH